jgi:hypothetical protein
VKDFLKLEIRRLQTEIAKREQQKKTEETSGVELAAAAQAKPSPVPSAGPKTYTEVIKNYGKFCFHHQL